MAQITVAIIGLDRLGASFGLATKRIVSKVHTFTVIGYDSNPGILQTARKLGALDQAEKNLDTAVSKADLIFIAARYSSTEDIFSVIGPAMRPGAVVMDASPLKIPSIKWAKKTFRKDAEDNPEVYLVGVTPILNPSYLEDARLATDAASADLFDKGLFFLAPTADCPDEAIQLAVDFINLLGVTVRFMDAAEHDGLVAATHGLPILFQLALFRSLNSSPSWDDMQKLGNPVFGLATHLLDTNQPEDLAATVFRNRENVIQKLNALIDSLTELRDLMQRSDAEELDLAQTYADSIDRYARWRSARNRNDWNETPKMPDVQAPGMMGGLFGRRRPKEDDDKK